MERESCRRPPSCFYFTAEEEKNTSNKFVISVKSHVMLPVKFIYFEQYINKTKRILIKPSNFQKRVEGRDMQILICRGVGHTAGSTAHPRNVIKLAESKNASLKNREKKKGNKEKQQAEDNTK